jgi:periplasmic protein TonB
MMALGAEDFTGLRRWAISGALVVLAHGGIAAAMVTWREPIDPIEPAAAIVIHLAPLPVAPAVERPELPPGPEQVMQEASPNKPAERVEDEIEETIEQKVEAKTEEKVEERIAAKPLQESSPEVPPAPDPEVAVAPAPPPEVKQQAARPQAPSPPVPVTSAPQVEAEEKAATPAAPAQGPPNPMNSPAVQIWQKEVFALLKRNLRYPPKAAARGQTGVAHLSFTLDRQGRVVDSRIVRSAGIAELDQEALALLRRAQPLPVPPPELPDERVTVNAPIRFMPPGAARDARR